MRVAVPFILLAILAIPAASAANPVFSANGQILVGGGPPTQCAAGSDVTDACVNISPTLATHGYWLRTASSVPPTEPVYVCFYASGLTLLRCDTSVLEPDTTAIDTRGKPLSGIPVGTTLVDIGGYGAIGVSWLFEVY